MARTASLATLLSVFLSPIAVHAQLAITELMYDLEGGDSGREWIEVQNVGTESIALSEWKLFESDSNHGLTTEGSDALAPGQFAIIADDPGKFRADWPSYAGLVVNSSFSLSNTGESLALRCCGKDPTDRDTVSYTSETGAAGDGNSLHRNGSGWGVGAPSPGSGAVLAPIAVPAEASQKAEPEAAPGVPPPTRPKTGSISIDAGDNRTALAKSAIALSARALTSKKEPIEQADFSWNFGDGRTGNGKSIMHAWGYPGKYQVTVRLAYEGENASDSFVVDVIEPDFSVLRFDDGSIGIRNDGTREADVSHWRVQEDGKNFVLPEGTVILRNALLRLSPETLGFIATRAALHYPDGALFARAEEQRAGADAQTVSHVVVPQLPAVPIPASEEPPRKSPTKRASAPVETEEPVRDEPQPELAPESDAVVQTAAAGAASGEVLSGAWYWWLGALGISLIGAVGMLVLRKPRDEWAIEDGNRLE
jgi:hypothetical protein